MHTTKHKKGNAAKKKEKRTQKQGIKVWVHGTGVNKVIEV